MKLHLGKAAGALTERSIPRCFQLELYLENQEATVPSEDKPEIRLPSWRAMHADTSPSIERIQLRFFRDAPAWRKLEMAGELRKSMLLFLQSELKERHPSASHCQIQRLIVERIYGSELAGKIYGAVSVNDDEGKIS